MSKAGKVRREGRKDTSGYTTKDHGQGDSFLPWGDKTIDPSFTHVRIIKAKFKERAPLILRPWGALDDAAPSERILSGRSESGDAWDMTNWMVRVPAVVYVGVTPEKSRGGTPIPGTGGEVCTFIPFMPGTDESEKQHHPYKVLYRRAVKGPTAGFKWWRSEWNLLVLGDGPACPKMIKPATHLWYVQGEFYKSGKEDFLKSRDLPLGAAKDDPTCITTLTDACGRKLMNLFNARDDAGKFILRDPIGTFNPQDDSLKGGVFLYVYNPDEVAIEFKPGYGTFDPKEKEDAFNRGYHAGVKLSYLRKGEKIRPDLDSSRTLANFNKWQFWFEGENFNGKKQDGLLYCAPIEEQMVWIAKAFKPAGKMVETIWEQEGIDMSDEVRGIFAERTSSSPSSKKKRDKEDEEDDDADDDDEDDDTPRRPKKDVTQKKGKAFADKKGKGKSKPKDDEDDEDEEEDDDSDDSDDDDDDDDDDDEEEEERPAKKSSKKDSGKKPDKKSSKYQEEEDLDEEEEDDDEEDEDDSDDEDDDDEDDEAEPPPSKKGKDVKKGKDPKKKAKPEPEEDDDSDDEEEDDEENDSDSDDEDDDEDDSDDEDDDEEEDEGDDEEEDDEDDEPPEPKAKSKDKGKEKPKVDPKKAEALKKTKDEANKSAVDRSVKRKSEPPKDEPKAPPKDVPKDKEPEKPKKADPAKKKDEKPAPSKTGKPSKDGKPTKKK